MNKASYKKIKELALERRKLADFTDIGDEELEGRAEEFAKITKQICEAYIREISDAVNPIIVDNTAELLAALEFLRRGTLNNIPEHKRDRVLKIERDLLKLFEMTTVAIPYERFASDGDE